MIRSESTSAFGHPRLTKLTRGEDILGTVSLRGPARGGAVAQSRRNASRRAARTARTSMSGRGGAEPVAKKAEPIRKLVDCAVEQHFQRDIEDHQQADIGDPAVAGQQARHER